MAIVLAVFPHGGNTSATATGPAAGISSKVRPRGALSGTQQQRIERFRTLWRSVVGGKVSAAEHKLATELIGSLPAPVLKELLAEFAVVSLQEGDPACLKLMAHRIGDLEGEHGVEWLLGMALSMAGSEEHVAVFSGLVPETLRGWSEGDPLGLLSAYFDNDKAHRFGIDERFDPGQGSRGMGATVIASAARRSPEEAWLLLGKWKRRGLAEAFFDGVDPAQARHYAGRLAEVFEDLERPGFEHLGGDQENWETRQKAILAAAGGLFMVDPDQALAWQQEELPVFADNEPTYQHERGKRAGLLSARLYREEPGRALKWIESQESGFRAGAAAELGYAILARPLAESDYPRLATLKSWTGGEAEQLAWLQGISRALSRAGNGADTMTQVASQLGQNLDLTPNEQLHLRQFADW